MLSSLQEARRLSLTSSFLRCQTLLIRSQSRRAWMARMSTSSSPGPQMQWSLLSSEEEGGRGEYERRVDAGRDGVEEYDEEGGEEEGDGEEWEETELGV